MVLTHTRIRIALVALAGIAAATTGWFIIGRMSAVTVLSILAAAYVAGQFMSFNTQNREARRVILGMPLFMVFSYALVILFVAFVFIADDPALSRQTVSNFRALGFGAIYGVIVALIDWYIGDW